MFEIINMINDEIKEIKTMKKVVKQAIKKEKLKNIDFNIIIVDNDYIHKLNRDYRKKDSPTDVITFALEDSQNEVELPIRMLGDIYISLDQAKIQAKEYEHSLERELSFLAIHGFYHLLGYDHLNEEDEKIMFQKQKEVIDEAGVKR